MSWLLVALGAAAGSVLRYLADRVVTARFGHLLPWGTLVVNVVASFVLGLVTGLSPEPARLLLGVGLCGGLSTYSTFSHETLRLVEEGRTGQALANVGLSVTLSLAAALAGLTLAA